MKYVSREGEPGNKAFYCSFFKALTLHVVVFSVQIMNEDDKLWPVPDRIGRQVSSTSPTLGPVSPITPYKILIHERQDIYQDWGTGLKWGISGRGI